MINHKLSAKARIEFIRLFRTKGIGPIKFFEILRQCQDLELLTESAKELFATKNIKKYKIPEVEEAEKELEHAQKFGAQIICYYDEEYPELLKHIVDPPPLLTVKGDISLFDYDLMAIVGSRNVSFQAIKFTKNLVQELSQAKIVTVSGLARGVDGICHQESLSGGTIAVTAAGIDNIYPYENKLLFEKIAEEGLLVTEFAYGSAPKATNFVQRNRVISGLSYGVIVVEAGEKSGSITTARFANEQGREVFAVPSFPGDARSAGCNKLIAQGACFTIEAEDVIEKIADLRRGFRGSNKILPKIVKKTSDKSTAVKIKAQPRVKIDNLEQFILQKLGNVEISIEDIYNIVKAQIVDINIALSQLQLEGLVDIKHGKVIKI